MLQPGALQPAPRNVDFFGYLNAFGRGVVSLWIVGVCIAGQGFLYFTFDLITEPIVGYVAGVWNMLFLFGLPALTAVILGVVGLPCSCGLLCRNTWDLFAGQNLFDKIFGFIGVVYKMFSPFQFKDPQLWFLWWMPTTLMPTWLFWLIFREPATELYSPTKPRLVNDEYWIFVNGVATTETIAFSNVNLLSDMFRRPIWLCHNPTDGILFDLFECVIGKIGIFRWYWEPTPNGLLTGALRQALREAPDRYTRVVVICHSQGTIITSNALQTLAHDAGDARLMTRYLEVYAFANCSHIMPGANYYLENISNGRDTVAWLGALFPFKNEWQDIYGENMDIGGVSVEEPTYWGHLLNTHYLHHFRTSYAGSRLHTLLDGRGRLAPVVRPPPIQ
jgi:hypothetical protein